MGTAATILLPQTSHPGRSRPGRRAFRRRLKFLCAERSLSVLNCQRAARQRPAARPHRSSADGAPLPYKAEPGGVGCRRVRGPADRRPSTPGLPVRPSCGRRCAGASPRTGARTRGRRVRRAHPHAAAALRSPPHVARAADRGGRCAVGCRAGTQTMRARTDSRRAWRQALSRETTRGSSAAGHGCRRQSPAGTAA